MPATKELIWERLGGYNEIPPNLQYIHVTVVVEVNEP